MADEWLVGAGYTFNNNVNLSEGYLYNEPTTAQTPRHLLKLWTSKRLPGILSRWTVSGTVHAQSANFYVTYLCPTNNCASTGLQYLSEKQGSYAVADARVEYDLGSHWKLALRIDNAFDHTYYQTVGIPSGGNWYGEPRNYTFTVTGSL
jgi:outer membrane receptor for ferric coprogen and ferric-rhodotorulic acid